MKTTKATEATETQKTYNGWTNYETWVVNLWLENDQGGSESCLELAVDALRNPGAYRDLGLTDAECAGNALADTIKAMHEEQLPEVSGFAADLLNAAMSEVNWYEIAASWVAKAQEEGVAK